MHGVKWAGILNEVRPWGTVAGVSEELISLEADWEGNEFLELAEASAGIGVWDMDLATGLVRGRPQFFRVMGVEPSARARFRGSLPILAPP